MNLALQTAQNFPDFRKNAEPIHADAVTKTIQLLDYLKQRGCSQEEQEALKKAADLMFHLHAKPQVDGPSYVYHTIAVAEMLVYQFEVSSAVAVISAFLHDALEDGSVEINRLTGRGTDNPCPTDAVNLLQRMFLRGQSPLGEYLKQLTNPDFSLLVEALKNPDGSQDFELATKLFEACVEAHKLYIPTDPQNFTNPRKVWNGLYLGKLYRLFTSDSPAAAVKAADFTVNALRLSPEGLDPAQFDRYRMKYGPVAEFLKNYLDGDRPTPAWLNVQGRNFLMKELSTALNNGLYLVQGKEG